MITTVVLTWACVALYVLHRRTATELAQSQRQAVRMATEIDALRERVRRLEK
jgi:hypothetical protein